MIELDLQDVGVDVWDDVLLAARSWRWLRARITGLLSRPCPYDPWTGVPIWQTRLQQRLFPPPDDKQEAG